MSDAPAPGPSGPPPDDEGERDAPSPGGDAVPTGEPDATLVEEASAEDVGPGTDPRPTPDGPTGLPDETTVAEVADEARPRTEDQPGTRAVRTGDDGAPTDGEPEAGGAGGEPEPEAGPAAAPDPVLEQLVEVRAGVEAMLPDLAATAREETVSNGLAGLQKGLDEMVRLTRRADEHVAELHAENQRLRGGELTTALQPMLRDVVRLHDEVTRLAEASHPEAQADLELVRSRLLDTLARWGLTPFAPAPGDAVDATRHQGVGRVPSSDGEPGTIATVRRPGFAHDDGRTFRAAEVEVFAPPPAPPAPPTEET